MRLLHLTLPVSDVTGVAAYFRDVLQLPVSGNRIHIGWSTIELRLAEDVAVGGVHLAFNVPDNRFAAAMTWLRERTPLQRNPAGLDYFALESSWQSQSVYFTGPDGLILELIGRRRLPCSPQEGAFHGSEMTCLSEVGLPSHDVDSVRLEAAGRFGLQPISAPSAQFAPMGDDEGLLIVVAADRRWFPEQKDLPNARGLQVLMGDVPAGELRDAELGWEVRAVPHRRG
ncbi:VOC family protein [Stenotrophomonas maltophilia]|uniref:VOC family protein n=1 Tax=Stenotrophomonas maltophilia TaxID=40324 RepID=UPI0021C807DA|nr:VOC family protein [Stenotrophomonas maltophilia]MCU1022572.1 VOC family protein [Stenotrophomonas maltophilia]